MNAATLLPLLKLLIPLLTPMIVAGLKKGSSWTVGHIPSMWLPVIAPVVGAAIAGLSGATDLTTGATLGLAGVGVREVVDQARTRAGLAGV